MNSNPHCPSCQSTYTYPDGKLWVCPECAHEWSSEALVEEFETITPESVKDAYGTILTSGDSVSIIKELKIKGASSALKVGTKVKNIRIIDQNDGHNIACKIDGIGAINLKSEFVKKL